VEEWQPAKRDHEGQDYAPFPIHTLSCFNASAALCTPVARSLKFLISYIFTANILSEIVQTIYAVRPSQGRHSESLRLGEMLDKWLLDLPEHLRFDPNSWKKSHPPSPFVLTLHMQYWCVVLLLHRPL
jgi:hypothetical protein